MMAQGATGQGIGGLVDIGASGAKRAVVSVARDFDLCDLRAVVAVVEGTVQIVFLADGWEGGPRKAMANVFADSATPGQLRALADFIASLPPDLLAGA